jgi:ankyrin repeat protein
MSYPEFINACIQGSVEIVERILYIDNNNTNNNINTFYLASAVLIAYENNNSEIAEKIIEKLFTFYDVQLCFTYTCQFGDIKMFEKMLNKYHLDKEDFDKGLFYACITGDFSGNKHYIIEKLIILGANLYSALVGASSNNNIYSISFVKKILKLKKFTKDEIKSAMYNAFMYDNIKTVNMLIKLVNYDYDCDIDKRNIMISEIGIYGAYDTNYTIKSPKYFQDIHEKWLTEKSIKSGVIQKILSNDLCTEIVINYLL